MFYIAGIASIITFIGFIVSPFWADSSIRYTLSGMFFGLFLVALIYLLCVGPPAFP